MYSYMCRKYIRICMLGGGTSCFFFPTYFFFQKNIANDVNAKHRTWSYKDPKPRVPNNFFQSNKKQSESSSSMSPTITASSFLLQTEFIISRSLLDHSILCKSICMSMATQISHNLLYIVRLHNHGSVPFFLLLSPCLSSEESLSFAQKKPGSPWRSWPKRLKTRCVLWP